MPIDLTKYDPDDIVEYVASMVGTDFMRVVQIAQDVIDNHSKYLGLQALSAAKRLSAYRVKMGVLDAYYKQKSVATKDPQDRLIKEAIIVINHNLEEAINCLKLAARELQ